jgi:hypothetical protein
MVGLAAVCTICCPPGEGQITVRDALPELDWLYGQRVQVYANGRLLKGFNLPFGDFELSLTIPADLRGQLVHLTIDATMAQMPGRLTLKGDRRRLAYLLKSIRWSGGASEAFEEALPAVLTSA